jgi:hypothetical protein
VVLDGLFVEGLFVIVGLGVLVTVGWLLEMIGMGFLVG